jgi:hypothetical protein
MASPRAWSGAALAGVILSWAAVLDAQTVPPDMEPIVDATKAYVAINVYDDGRPRSPDIAFYRFASLSGRPIARLDRNGFSVDGELICLWHPTAFATSNRQITLHSPDSPATPCPSEVPVKTVVGQIASFLEISRVNSAVGQIRFRSRHFYFDLSKFPDAFQDHKGPLLNFPLKSPPVVGGVDVPSAFRPKRGQRLALNLYDRPSEDARPIIKVTSVQYLDTMGIGEGTLLASVYRRSNRWSLLRFVDGRLGWLSPADSGKYMSHERLVSIYGEDTYLTHRWDRKLAATPGGALTLHVPTDPRRRWMGWLFAEGKARLRVPVFPRPDRNEAPLGMFGDGERVRLLELPDSAFHQRPVVFSQREGWIEVAMDDSDCYRPEGKDRAWLEDVPGRWRIEVVNQSKADDIWFAAWGKASNTAAKLLEIRRVGVRLWFRVRVFLGEGCERGLCRVTETVIGEGWLPAHDRYGQSIIWFETYCD